MLCVTDVEVSSSLRGNLEQHITHPGEKRQGGTEKERQSHLNIRKYQAERNESDVVLVGVLSGGRPSSLIGRR